MIDDNIKLIPYRSEFSDFIYLTKKNAYKKYVEERWGVWDEKKQKIMFEKFINMVKNDTYIIQFDGVNVGFYNGETLEDGSYEIGNICIIPEYQGKSIGTKVLKYFMELHKKQNLHIQYFKQNPVGVLYKRLGFVPDYEKDFHYVMKKTK